MKWKNKKPVSASQTRNFTIMRLRGIVGQTKSIEKNMSQLADSMTRIRFEIDVALDILNTKSQHDHEREK